jgi:hypothetical protein
MRNQISQLSGYSNVVESSLTGISVRSPVIVTEIVLGLSRKDAGTLLSSS